MRKKQTKVYTISTLIFTSLKDAEKQLQEWFESDCLNKDSREIKFRIWDKVAKKIIQVNSLIWDITGKLISFNSGNFSDLMQYTGLKDRNGKEIYEGDIIRNVETNQIGEVCFPDCGFWVKKMGEMSKLCSEELEIIGNIYENPELIEN